MKFQTFSIISGSEACNARCPFCISKMTPPLGVELREPDVNWRNFDIACRLAAGSRVMTVMLTGKGEPTLFPKQITAYLTKLEAFLFPIVELQTNGILLADRYNDYSEYLDTWYQLGLTTIAISIVDIRPENNRLIYLPHRANYIDLAELIAKLHENKFSVRLSCTLCKGFIDNSQHLQELIDFARVNRVEQVTIRPVDKSSISRNDTAYNWTAEHCLSDDELNEITKHIEKTGKLIRNLRYGSRVFDISGQNLCMTSSLSSPANAKTLRNLIFYPDGHLRYDWQYPGALIL